VHVDYFVVTSQAAAPVNERNDIDILSRQVSEANVLLIKAMGGEWDLSSLLSYRERPISIRKVVSE
jgi:hypothetical protein